MIEDAYVGHNTPILADVSDARDYALARRRHLSLHARRGEM